MKPENRKYRIELGINLHAAPVPQTNANLRIFPLQNALIDITEGEAEEAKPAWYSKLGIGDTLSFRLVDISHRRAPEQEITYPSLALAELYFCNPSTGQPADPFTESIGGWRISERSDDRYSPVFSLDSEHLLPNWDIVGANADGELFETLEFADFTGDGGDGDGGESDGEEDREAYRAFELTVAIKMARDGWVNHYVFDPEMIVSETDNEGDQSGGGTK